MVPTPTGDGSRTKFDGPVIVAVLPAPLIVTLFWNVEIPETFRVSVSVWPVTSIPLDLVASFREP